MSQRTDLSDKQPFSKIGVQGEAGLPAVEGQVGQHCRAVLQLLQVSGGPQGLVVLVVEADAVLAQLAEQGPARSRSVSGTPPSKGM